MKQECGHRTVYTLLKYRQKWDNVVWIGNLQIERCDGRCRKKKVPLHKKEENQTHAAEM
jgi:hypothetical protein